MLSADWSRVVQCPVASIGFLGTRAIRKQNGKGLIRDDEAVLT